MTNPKQGDTSPTLILPGTEFLGRAIDIFGMYSRDQTTTPLYTWTPGQPYNTEYAQANNTSAIGVNLYTGSSTSFESRQSVSSYFTSQASLNISGTFFNAEFEADYTQINQDDLDYIYGMSEYHASLWNITLQDATQVASYVAKNVFYMNIPTSYTPENQSVFFAFFDAFASHFVTSVTVGGRFYYTAAVSTSSEYDSTAVQANMSIETDALFFASSSAQASIDWQKVTTSWTQARDVNLIVVGGDTSIMGALQPVYGNWDGQLFQNWLASVTTSPGIVGYTVSDISPIFPPEKQAAVKAAAADYVATHLYLESATGSCLIRYNGLPAVPEGGGQYTWGFQASAYDRNTMKQVFANSYAITNTDDWLAANEAIMNDLAPYLDSNHVIAMSSWTMLAWAYPNVELASLMEALGADLTQWANLNALENYANWVHLNFCLVGVPNEAPIGKWQFTRAPGPDTGNPPWNGSMAWNALPAPPITLIADITSFRPANTAKRSNRSQI
jgi:hypothetical protein